MYESLVPTKYHNCVQSPGVTDRVCDLLTKPKLREVTSNPKGI